MNVFSEESLPKGGLDYFIYNFVDMKHLSSAFLQQSYFFHRVLYIRNKRIDSNKLFCVEEYLEGAIPFETYIKDLNQHEILDLFMEVLSALNYLHVNGYSYGELNGKNIMVLNGHIKLHSLIDQCIEQQRIPESNTKCFQDDIKLAVNYLQQIVADVRLEPIYEDANRFHYASIVEMVDSINYALDTSYDVIRKEDLDTLRFYVPIVGRDQELKDVMHALDLFIEEKSKKRIFLINGNTGIGKTRFLNEIYFRASMKNTYVYMKTISGTSGMNNYCFWNELLQEITFNTDPKIVAKYKDELKDFFPEVFIGDGTKVDKSTFDGKITRYRLINRIAAYIKESIQGQTTVFILDNLHNADSITLDIIHYFIYELIDNSNIFAIASYNKFTMQSPACEQMVQTLKQKEICNHMSLNGFNEEETGTFLKFLLSMSFSPKLFAKQVYEHSNGNPFFITEMIKEMYTSHRIWRSELTGVWNINLPDVEDGHSDFFAYSQLEIKRDINEIVYKYIESLDEEEMEILKVLSVFNIPISLDTLSSFISYDDLQEKIDKLIHRNIISQKVSEQNDVYFIESDILNRMIYERLSEEECKQLHLKVIEYMESHEMYLLAFDDFIRHLNKVGLNVKAVHYCIENAKKMHKMKNLHAEILNYELALDNMKKTNPQLRFRVLLKLGTLRFEIGDNKRAINTYEIAVEHARGMKDVRCVVEGLIYLTNMYARTMMLNVLDDSLEEIKVILKEIDYPEAEAGYKRLNAYNLLHNGKVEEALVAVDEVFAMEDQCTHNEFFNRTLGSAYLLKGFILNMYGKCEEAMKYGETAYKIFVENESVSNALSAIINMACIYADYYLDREKAYELFEKVIRISKEYGMESDRTLFAYVNLGIYYFAEFDYENSYRYYIRGLEIAENRKDILFLFLISCNLCVLNNARYCYDEAFEDFKRAKKLMDTTNVSIYVNSFYQAAVNEYIELGDYKQGLAYLEKHINLETHPSEEDLIYLKAFKYIYTIHISKHEERLECVEKFMEIYECMKRPNYRFEALVTMSSSLLEVNEVEQAKKIFDRIDPNEGLKVPEIVRERYDLLKAVLLKDEDVIKELEHFVTHHKDKMLLEYAYIVLGNYYFEKDRYLAAKYYLEACGIIHELMVKVPKEYRMSFMNSHYRIAPYQHLIELYKHKELQETKTIETLDELRSMIYNDIISIWMEDDELLDICIAFELEKRFGEIITVHDVLRKIGELNYNQGIDYLFDFLQAKMLAYRCMIISKDDNDEYKAIYSTGSMDMPEDLTIFDLAQTDNSVCIIDSQAEIDLGEGISKVACIPMQHRKLHGYKDTYGFLYLESNTTVNNFNHSGLEECKGLVNILSMMIVQENLRIEASIDKLTGAYTRKYLDMILQETMRAAQQEHRTFSIVMYDLDKFKRVNDTYGHTVGDKVLRRVSEIVLESLEEDQTLGRYGGEEFVIIYPDKTGKEAHALAEKLRIAIEEDKILGDRMPVTASMGVVNYPKHSKNIFEMVEYVDKSLYAAKESGRNRCYIFKQEYNALGSHETNTSGILTGNDAQDARNILAITELLHLVNEDIPKDRKLDMFLERILETIQAGNCMYVRCDYSGNVFKTICKQNNAIAVKQPQCSSALIKDAIKRKNGIFAIDWEASEKSETIAGLSVLESVMCIPLMHNNILYGCLYLTIPISVKEFTKNDFDLARAFGDILVHVIC